MSHNWLGGVSCNVLIKHSRALETIYEKPVSFLTAAWKAAGRGRGSSLYKPRWGLQEHIGTVFETDTDTWKVRFVSGMLLILSLVFVTLFFLHILSDKPIWCIMCYNVWNCNFFIFFLFADLSIHHVNLELSENRERHRTGGFSSSNSLVVRRGDPFRISVQFKRRPFNPTTDSLKIDVMLGNMFNLNICRSMFISHLVWYNKKKTLCLLFLFSGGLYTMMPVTFSRQESAAPWNACIDSNNSTPQNLSIFISCPAFASVGCYKFQLSLYMQNNRGSCVSGSFVVLCNPWCSGECDQVKY